MQGVFRDFILNLDVNKICSFTCVTIISVTNQRSFEVVSKIYFDNQLLTIVKYSMHTTTLPKLIYGND